MRRTIALTSLAALALTLGPVATARADHGGAPATVVIDWVSPADGDTVSGVVPVEIRFHENSALRDVTEWSVTLDGEALCSWSNPEPELGWSNSVQTIAFQWDTTKAPAGGQTGCNASTVVPGGSALSANGGHTLDVAITTSGPGDELGGNTATRQVTVANAPATPSGVKLAYSKSSDTITVSWNDNPEPDVVSYRLAECIVDRSSKPCGESDWQAFPKPVDGTKVALETAGPGVYRYRVAAIRGSLVSGWATAQGDPTEITVTEDPKPTTSTTAPPAGVDDGSDEPRVVTRTVVQPTRRVQRTAPRVLNRVVTNEDRPYSDTLPYEEAGEAGRPLAGEEGDGDQLTTLIPLAGGVLFLMIGGHLWYLNRRSNALQMLPAEGDDFGVEYDDWR